MGNKSSVTLSISLDLKGDAVAKAGQPLTGKVAALVRGKVPDGKLTIFLSGKEATYINSHFASVRDKKKNPSKKKRSRRGERRFLSVNLLLHDAAKRKLKAGSYEFPFSIMLPDILPTTTSLNASSSGFQISYEIRAEIGKFNIKKSFAVESAPLPPDKVPCILRPTTHEVRQLGLLKKGTLTLGASVEDTHVGRGGVLEVSLACRNDSTVTIQRVQVKVVELLIWKTGEEGEDYSATEKRVLVDLNDVDLPGLLKGKRDWSELRASQKNSDSFSRNQQDIFEDLVSGYNKILLNIPQGTRDTYRGQLVDVSHYIKIKLITNSLTDCPFAKIPLKIGFPSIATSPSSPPVGFPSIATSPSSPPVAPLPANPSMNPAYQPPSVANHQQHASGEAVVLPEGQIATDQSCDDIPMVAAILVNDDGTYVLSSPVHASPESIVLGGSARMLDSTEEEEMDLGRLAPVAPHGITPLPPPAAPSLPRLMDDIAASVNDFDLISRRLRDPHWKSVFASLTSNDFGDIIRRINVQFDQPRIAELLAPHVNGGANFTCEFAAAAVRNTSEWNRATMVTRLLPFCIDISVNHHLIENELHDWEKVVTKRDIELAIAQCY